MSDDYMEVSVYGHETPTERMDYVPNALSPKFLEEIVGEGAGQFSLSLLDKKFLSQTSLLDYRNVVKLSCGGVVRSAFIIGNDTPDFIDQAENASKTTTVSGSGLKSWLEGATVFPEGGLKQSSPDNRVFSWASKRGAWFTASEWKAPVKVEQYHMQPDKTKPDLRYVYSPAEWPDAPQAWWVWSQLPTFSTVGGKRMGSTPPGNAYFRYEFTVAPGNEGDYSLFAAADNAFVAFIDSALAIDATTPAGMTHHRETVRYDFTLEAGPHVLAFRVTNFQSTSPNNPAALIAALFKAGDADAGVAASIVTVTGAAGWLVNGYPTSEPGWTIGEIWTTLLQEAKDRGIRFPNWVIPNFTADLDSNGVPWAERLPFSFNVGDTYLDVLHVMEDLAVESWVDPDTYALNIVQKRGKNKSVVTDTDDAVTLREGWNLTKASSQGEADLTNTLLMKTEDGWVVAEPSSTASKTKYGRLEGSINTSVSGVLSRKLADKVFQTKASPEVGTTYGLIPRPGAEPFKDFGIGDYVLAPNAKGADVERRVMSIAITGDIAGNPLYAVEFDTIFQTKEAEYDRMAKRASGSGLGAGFVSADGAGKGGSAPSTGTGTGYKPAAPRAPENLSAESTGFFTNSGAARSKVVFTWDATIADINGVGITTIDRYEVLGRAADTTAFQSLGVVSGAFTTLTVTNLASDIDWLFVIRASVDSTRVSEYSDPAVLHHTAAPAMLMPAPSKPTLTSKLGTVTVMWNGLLGTGVPPVQFGYVYAEYRVSPATAWTQEGAISGKGGIVVTNLAVGTSFEARLRAIDSLGRASDPSASTTIVVKGVDTSDLGQDFQDSLDQIEQNSSDAQTAAGEAATAAQEALEAAQEAAGNAGGVLYQEAVPTAEQRRFLWIRKSDKKAFVWDATLATPAWVESTDPRVITAATNAANALDAATRAENTANAAAGQAGQALTAANGKNRVWYLATPPAGTGHKIDDTWFDTDDGNRIYKWDGDSWEVVPLGTNAIADLAITNSKIGNLDAGKITTGFLDAGRIQSASISSRMLAVGDFKNYLEGSDFEGDAASIPWTNIPDANALLSVNVKHNGAKSVQLLPTGPYQAPPVTTVTTIQRNMFTNPEAQNDTVGWASVAGRLLTRGNLATVDRFQGAPTAVWFYPGLNTGSATRLRTVPFVVPGSVVSFSLGLRINITKALTIAVTFMTASGAADAGATRYLAPTVTQSPNVWRAWKMENLQVPPDANRMVIEIFTPSGGGWDSDNRYIIATAVMLNEGSAVLPYFNGNSASTTVDNGTTTTTTTHAWTGTAGNSSSTKTIVTETIGEAPEQPNRLYAASVDIPVQVDQTFVLTAWIRGANQYNGDASGAYLEIRDAETFTSLGRVLIGRAAVPADFVWTKVSCTVKVPAGTNFIRPHIRVNHTRGFLYIDDIAFKNGAGVLIEDGAITAPLIAANAITADSIAAGAVQTEQLDAYAITSKHTITGALIRTAESGARTEMNASGLRVVGSDNTDLVRLGFNQATGMSIKDPNTGLLTPLANMAFGTSFFFRTAGLAIPTTAAENTWSAYVNETFGGQYNAPSSRALVIYTALAANQTVTQNFNIGGTLDFIPSSNNPSYVRLKADMWVTWTSGMYMGVISTVPGETYTVRNSYRSQRTFSGTGTPSVIDRGCVVIPM
jgi:hypothetical protein